MINKETKKILRDVYKNTADGVNNFKKRIEQHTELARHPKGLDTSVSGLINAERALEQFKQLQSQILSGAISTASSLVLKNYVLNFSYVVNPALKTMSSSMGGYFDILATAVADQERLKQQYRTMGVQNLLQIGGLFVSDVGFRLIAARTSVPAFVAVTSTIRNLSSTFITAFKTTRSVAGAVAAATAVIGTMGGGGVLAGALAVAVGVALIKALIAAAVIALAVYAVSEFLKSDAAEGTREAGEGLLENIYEGLYSFRENMMGMKDNLEVSLQETLNSFSEASEIMRTSGSWLERFAALTSMSAYSNAATGLQFASGATSLAIEATNIVLGDPNLLDELTKQAQTRALMQMFDPKNVNAIFLNNAFLLGTEIQKNGSRGDGLELLVGTEFQDALYNNLPDNNPGSLSSRVYRQAYEGNSSRIFGELDLGGFGIDNAKIISTASNLEIGTQTGYSENVIATIMSVSGIYSGGITNKMEQIMQNIIRSNAFDANDVSLATEKFEEFFAAAVGNGKPQEAHLRIVASLSDFSLGYAAGVKMNLDSTSEIAKIHQFMSDDGTVNNRFSADPTKNIIKSLDNMLLQGATYTNLGATQIFNAIGISREEAIQGVTANADVFDRTLSGIIDYMNVSKNDIIEGTPAFDEALQNFSMVSGFGADSLNPLMVALKRRARGESIEEIREEYYENALTATEKSVISVRGSMELAESANLFKIQENIVYSANKLIEGVNTNLDVISIVQSMINQLVIDDFSDFATRTVRTLASLMSSVMTILLDSDGEIKYFYGENGAIGGLSVHEYLTNEEARAFVARGAILRGNDLPSFESVLLNNSFMYTHVYNSLGAEGRSNFTPEFFAELTEISKRVRIPLAHLIAIINFETMGTFSPSIRPTRRDGTLISSAVGLIQFMSNTARGLGTTTEELLDMTSLEQLKYVEAYFMQRHIQSKINENPNVSLTDAYLFVFTPSAAGLGENHVLYEEGSAAYAANSGLDVNKDGKITAGEIGARIRGHVDSRISGLYTNRPSVSELDVGKAIYKNAENVNVTAGWGATEASLHSHGHKGIDFVGLGNSSESKNIYSPVSGIVGVQTHRQLGTTVVVKDERGFYHVFAHLSEALVSPGDTIEKGTLLGVEGATGQVESATPNGSGAHLHYDIRMPTENYNPEEFQRNFLLNFSTLRHINPVDYYNYFGFALGGYVFQLPKQNSPTLAINSVQKSGNKNMHITIPLSSRNPVRSSQLFSGYMKSYLGS